MQIIFGLRKALSGVLHKTFFLHESRAKAVAADWKTKGVDTQVIQLEVDDAK
jgi:hypothetical protein